MIFDGITLYNTVEEMPTDVPEDVVVVVDVLYFSTTIVELLSELDYAYISPERGAEHDIREELDDTVVLCGNTIKPLYETQDGYDFFNSPSVVHEIELEDVDGSVITSTNGGRGVNKILNSSTDVDMFIASTTNGVTVGKYVSENYDTQDVAILCAGTKGKPSIEDYIAGVHIAAAYNDQTIPPFYSGHHQKVLKSVRGPFESVHPRRQKDIRIAIQFNSRSCIPVISGRTVRDIFD